MPVGLLSLFDHIRLETATLANILTDAKAGRSQDFMAIRACVCVCACARPHTHTAMQASQYAVYSGSPEEREVEGCRNRLGARCSFSDSFNRNSIRKQVALLDGIKNRSICAVGATSIISMKG